MAVAWNSIPRQRRGLGIGMSGVGWGSVAWRRRLFVFESSVDSCSDRLTSKEFGRDLDVILIHGLPRENHGGRCCQQQRGFVAARSAGQKA
jgi:hypothetical protein